MKNENKKRLSVRDPKFRYPNSPNPYSGKLKALAADVGSPFVYSDNDTETHRGRWRELLPDASGANAATSSTAETSRELHVEIGSNAGHVIIEWAARNPQHAYVGVDWKFKAMFKAAEKAHKRRIRNLLFFRAHAERVPFMFGEQEVDHLYLFFPDPWPKKAHWKNRYITEQSLRELATLIRPGGMFHIKTDHLGYFEWMEKEVAKVTDLWDVTFTTRDLHAGKQPELLDFPDVTLFEKIFIKNKTPIKAMNLKRR